MKDLVTYCPDLNALRKDLIDSAQVDEEGNPVLNVIKTPVQYSKDGLKSLSLVRCLTTEGERDLQFNHLEILGTYDEVFKDLEKMAKYESVYSTKPYDVEDDQGNTQTVTPPKKFVVFYD